MRPLYLLLVFIMIGILFQIFRIFLKRAEHGHVHVHTDEMKRICITFHGCCLLVCVFMLVRRFSNSTKTTI